MRSGQRIFMRLVVFVCFLTISPGFRETLLAADNRVLIADGKISLIIPDGWAKTELNAADVLAGYATQDNRNSVFFRAMDTSSTGGMQELLDATVANYEATFKVKDVSKAKTGQVEGPNRKWPGIFTTVEATVVKGEASFEMKFYLFVFDTGSNLYLMQASTTLPVRESREQQIYELMRSIVARP